MGQRNSTGPRIQPSSLDDNSLMGDCIACMAFKPQSIASEMLIAVCYCPYWHKHTFLLSEICNQTAPQEGFDTVGEGQNLYISKKILICYINNSMYVQSFYVQRLNIFINIKKNLLDIRLCDIIMFTSSLVLSLKDRDLETWFEVPACDAVPRAHVAVSSWCPKSSSTERTSIWYCCCRTASVQMLGFPRTFSSGMGFQKKLRTLRFFLVLVDEVDGGGGGGGGALGGRGGGGGAEILELLAASSMEWVCPDIEERSEALVMEEEAVQLPPSLLQLSGSLVVDGQLITSIPRRSSQHRLYADVKKNLIKRVLPSVSQSTG